MSAAPLWNRQPEHLISLVTANQAATFFHNAPLYEANKPQNSMHTATAAPASCFVIPALLKEEFHHGFYWQSIFIRQDIPRWLKHGPCSRIPLVTIKLTFSAREVAQSVKCALQTCLCVWAPESMQKAWLGTVCTCKPLNGGMGRGDRQSWSLLASLSQVYSAKFQAMEQL